MFSLPMAWWFVLAFVVVTCVNSGIQADEVNPDLAGGTDLLKTIFRRSRDDMLHLAKMLELRLLKWNEEHSDSFKKYHKALYADSNQTDIYDRYLEANQGLLGTRYKNAHYRAVAEYFKINAETRHDRIIKVDIGESIELERTTEDRAEFYLDEDPESVDYYRVKDREGKGWADLAFRYLNETKPSDSELALLRRKVYSETLDQTQAAVLDFRMNLIKNCFASLGAVHRKAADIFPSMTNVQSTTRIRNPKTNQCIGVRQYPSEERIEANDCDERNVGYDWHLIEVGEGDYKFKSIRFGKCLSYGSTHLQTTECHEAPVWKIALNTIQLKKPGSAPRVITCYAGEHLPSVKAWGVTWFDGIMDAQTWSVSLPYSVSPTNTQPTKRIYNRALNKCIGMEWDGASVAIKMGYCDNQHIHFDWDVIEIGEGALYRKPSSYIQVLLRNVRFGYCLGTLESYRPQLIATDCTVVDTYTISWDVWSEVPVIVSGLKRSPVITAVDEVLGNDHGMRVTVDSEARPEPLDSQKWFLSSTPSAATASYYKKKSSERDFIRNFPKLLMAYMFSEFNGSEIRGFFKGLQHLPYYAQCPELIQRMGNAVANDGKTILTAYKDVQWYSADKLEGYYKEMRSRLVWYPEEAHKPSFISQINDQKSSSGLLKRLKDSKVSYNLGEASKPGDMYLEPSTDKVYETRKYGPMSADNWLLIRDQGASSGKLALTFFANYLNDLYLRAGLNMVSIVNPDNLSNERDMAIIKGYAKDDAAMDLLVDDAKSILGGVSPFSLTFNETLFHDLSDFIDIARWHGGVFGTVAIPQYLMTILQQRIPVRGAIW